MIVVTLDYCALNVENGSGKMNRKEIETCSECGSELKEEGMDGDMVEVCPECGTVYPSGEEYESPDQLSELSVVEEFENADVLR